MEQLPGPAGPIEFQRDRQGYPSIRAKSLLEGTFALGYLHALDRLTQVTFTALAARGELMSVLGDVPLARLIDRSARVLGLSQDVSSQVAACDSDSRALLTAYSEGFNRGAEVRGRPLALRMLGADSFVASPEGIFSIFRFITYFGLTSMQVSSELIVAELVARGAPTRVFERLLGQSALGLDLESLRNLQIPAEYSFFQEARFGSKQAGSNAFCVSAERSSSGGALLVGEFHMEVGRFPPLLYAAHLSLPDDEYLAGITIPGIAWFAAGRTRQVGWSYTFAHADNVDFLVERVEGGKYLAGSEWKAFRRREEVVSIRNKPSETWVFFENDYGTLLGDAEAPGERPCVRVSGLGETHRAFSAARRVLDCQNVEDLIEVQREVRSVSLEGILVDRAGAIASVVTGQIDQRPAGWTGAYPRRGWDLSERVPGLLGENLRPIAVSPASGQLVSANQGGHGPYRALWCTFPEPPYRFERISELISAREKHDLGSLFAISYDVFDASARRLLPIWAKLLPEHPLSKKLVAFASDQTDKQMLALFHTLHAETCFAMLEQDLSTEMARRFHEWSALALYQVQLDSVLALEQPTLLDEAGLRALLELAFPRAIERYRKQEQVPVRLRFKHMITQGRTPSFLGFDSRTIELPGSPVTAFQCRLSPISGQDLVYAPAFHLACDMSTDIVYYNLPGGASESRFGPGYGLGVEEWLAGSARALGDFTQPPLEISKR